MCAGKPEGNANNARRNRCRTSKASAGATGRASTDDTCARTSSDRAQMPLAPWLALAPHEPARVAAGALGAPREATPVHGGAATPRTGETTGPLSPLSRHRCCDVRRSVPHSLHCALSAPQWTGAHCLVCEGSRRTPRLSTGTRHPHAGPRRRRRVQEYRRGRTQVQPSRPVATLCQPLSRCVCEGVCVVRIGCVWLVGGD